MINMMYLVLMALLALNVSREILKSFHLMEVSFNRASEDLDSKIAAQLNSFKEQAGNDVTLKPYYNRALEAQRLTDEFVQYVENVKSELTEKTGGREEPEIESDKAYDAELVGNDNMEVHANYFMVDDNRGTEEPGWRGRALENQVNTTREKLLNLLKSDKEKGIVIDEPEYESVSRSCQLRAELTEREKGKYNSWSERYLENTPLAGVVTMLSKMQTDARSTQAMIMDVLNRGEDILPPVTKLVPMIKPVNGAVIMQGGTYEAEIFLAAQTRGSDYDEYVLESGTGTIEKRGDKWFYSVNGLNTGTHGFEGKITVKGPKGDKYYPFQGDYQVFSGGATISAIKMNALYIGVENDISIAVPGVKPDDVMVTISGGTIRKKGENYVVKCTQKGSAVISVNARLSDGTVRKVGESLFRVRKLPKPRALWGGISTGSAVPKQPLGFPTNVIATMGPEFLLDDITYNVLSYRFILSPKRSVPVVLSSKSSGIPQSVKNAIKNSKPGDRIIVDHIRAKGPSGVETLDPIMIEII